MKNISDCLSNSKSDLAELRWFQFLDSKRNDFYLSVKEVQDFKIISNRFRNEQH